MQPNLKKKDNKKRNLLWYLGAAGMFIVSNLKLLLPALKTAKAGSAFLSMLISVGAYALIYPWQFAVGFVLLIFVHEIGHVIAAKRKGFPVTAPMFIPFLGAATLLRRTPKDAVTEAYIAFGGPLIGSIGAVVLFGVAYWMDDKFLYSLTYVGLFINLLNLFPMNPLDGGRISMVVTRWLWLVGLIGGFFLIIYFRSFIFLILWLFFAYDLYVKYVKKRNKAVDLSTGASFLIEAEPLIQQGFFIPGPEHKRDLAFTTYSGLEGQQYVRIFWDGLNFEGTVPLQHQALIRRVQLIKLDHHHTENGLKLMLHCQIDYSQFINDAYYDVPIKTRWVYGFAYLGLAAFIGGMMWWIHDLTGMSM